MRVTFDHKEVTKGLFSKTLYVEVSATVIFSEEEAEIIRKRKLKDVVVFEREADALVMDRFGSKDPAYLQSLVDAGSFRLTIGKLMTGKPDTYMCANPVSAKNYEAEYTEKLKVLKDFLLGSSDIPETKSFEL